MKEPQIQIDGVFVDDHEEQWFSYGFCSDVEDDTALYLISDDLPEDKRPLWRSPGCKNAEDAMRIFFLVSSLMGSLDG